MKPRSIKVSCIVKKAVSARCASSQPLLEPFEALLDSASPRSRLHLRTREIALMRGRGTLGITQKDYEQAKREVTGEKGIDEQNAILDGVLSCP